MRTKGIYWRATASLVLLGCLGGLALSGAVVYFAPPCSVARAVGWEVMGLGKEEWEAVHIFLGLVMVAAGGVHLVFNIAALGRYLRVHLRELALAAGVVAWVVVWAWAGWWPVGSVVRYQEQMKQVWKMEVGSGGLLRRGEGAGGGFLAPAD